MNESREDVIELILSMRYELKGISADDFLFVHSNHTS